MVAIFIKNAHIYLKCVVQHIDRLIHFYVYIHVNYWNSNNTDTDTLTYYCGKIYLANSFNDVFIMYFWHGNS